MFFHFSSKSLFHFFLLPRRNLRNLGNWTSIFLLFPLFLRDANYSFFKAYAGLTFDTDMICQMTEPMAMMNERTAATAKIHQ